MGFLYTSNGITLTNESGKVICKKAKLPTSCSVGSKLTIGDKEVLITEIIKEEKLETKADTSVPVTSTDAKAKSTAGTRIVSSFKLPVGTTANTNTLIKPRHDSNSPNAIVLQPGSANTCPIVLDPYLQAKMRPHQIVGLKFLYSCVMEESEHGSGAILADTMGLGKTLQCIALLWTLLKQGIYGKPTCKKFLVITPSSLVNNWKCEFKKWLGV